MVGIDVNMLQYDVSLLESRMDRLDCLLELESCCSICDKDGLFKEKTCPQCNGEKLYLNNLGKKVLDMFRKYTNKNNI